MSLKILHVSSGLYPGGKQRQLIEIVKNNFKTDFEYGIVTFNANQHYSAQAKGYCAYFRELKKRPTRLEPFFSIWRCFKEFKPEIVHSWDNLSSLYVWLPCKILNIPFIDGSIRDAGVSKGWQYLLKRFFLKHSSMIISNSIAGLKEYNVIGHVIYNAIDTSRFFTLKENREFNIIMTANFYRYKDYQTFMNAAIILAGDHIVDNVYLLGDGPNKDKYRNWITCEYPEIAHRFHFTGNVSNVEEYLAKCHIGVLCSTPRYKEGLSNSVLEYMAAGLVPIVTNLGGSAEIIEDGKNGYLINPQDYQKIIELVRQLKVETELRVSLTNNGKKTIDDKFSMERNIEVLSSLYIKLITDFAS